MELAQFPDNIARIVTEKNFFKKYSYKICFQIEEEDLKAIKASMSRFSNRYWSDRAILRKRLKDKVVKLLPEGLDYRTRVEGESVSLFLDDDKVVIDIVNKLHNVVKEIHTPLSSEHKQLIHDNHRVRVRKTLFHNKYRFKVSIKNGWNEKFKKFDDLKGWLESMEPTGGDRWMPNAPLASVFKTTEEERNKPKFRYRFSNYAIFLNEEQDLMMLQLWLNEWYWYTEKAVLISEV